MTSNYLSQDTLDQQSDELVMSALHDGDLKALDILLQRYAGKVYSLAYRILSDVDEAESMTQEIFATLWQSPAGQDPSRQSPLGQNGADTVSSFLVTLTRSRSMERLENRDWKYAIAKALRTLLPSFNRSAFLSPDQLMAEEWHLDNAQEAIRAEQLFESLSRKERDILSLTYYDATNPKTLAKRLHIPAKIVKHRSRKALTKLHRTRVNLW